jgi:hypothetical protein
MRRAVLLTALLVAGCGSQSASNEANQPVSQSGPASESNRTGEAQANPAVGNKLGTLPSSDAALRFVGEWATSEANCASKPWRFSADTLDATDGPKCSIYKVSKVPGGYDLAAECPAKKPLPTDLIKLRFAESARAMLVESNAIAPMGLIYCGK